MIQFFVHGFISTFRGSRTYWLWVTFLLAVSLIGLNAWARQLAHGLATSGMGDEVSWGMYIANFVFLVGMAAAAVMMVIPAYIFKDREMHKIVVLSELFAVAAMVMCILFVTVDLGRPDRIWHMVPRLGYFNWPGSMLTWDVLVLNGYLLLNLYVCFYVLYSRFHGRKPKPALYIPVVFLAIGWAFSIHTTTAFLFQGLGGRPFWNSGLIAPRFLASAFAAGPSFMILVFLFLRKSGAITFNDQVIGRIRVIITVSLLINIFFAGSELFAEFYSDSKHVVHFSHLFGLHGESLLAPWIWTALGLNVAAAILLLSPARRNQGVLIVACMMIIVGIWTEKGLGFVIPAFIPTTLGDFVQYVPSVNELLVCVGVWAFGLLVYTLMLKGAIPIINREE
ncbi:Hdr menaquinol oxidoreductase integral membrane subunit [Desulfolithobacter dissulfuricans]|uniref:Hdr menaquinol oxidoreductase integral membrane subunit n=1 Tax=Desulfolithobacter dissulfuricans TaxID=2795293 RepID=A0A915XKQ6_9BACT|nr:NrfD/PsrC family molybdoenzyme membrane anchor subunit [Desulfolithobacter dissulfuricans]BCO09568.1 Hdr menaquinol oxidoreductase integral membrane subunit [Desulfolithobacter dissulfuricans]